MKIIRRRRIKIDSNLSSTKKSALTTSLNKSSQNCSEDDYGLKRIYKTYDLKNGQDSKTKKFHHRNLPAKKINFSEKNLLKKENDYKQKKNRIFSHKNNLVQKRYNFDK